MTGSDRVRTADFPDAGLHPRAGEQEIAREQAGSRGIRPVLAGSPVLDDPRGRTAA
ncbi:hypothetical protein [Microbacterium hydrothermale]|uniref:hypothetical protein n=1 Tax=Microbacterium hydrothermale TaxID=857427 RepID=UPI002225D750|nr:hypothetical protein [Microbacterium hydrothermale]